VCADPNNLPFSNSRGEGFENQLAALVARDLHATVSYTWWAQRRGFIRNTLKAGECDVVMGLPSGFEMAATTRPYYRSTYVFVTRAGRAPGLDSFDDGRLRSMRIGVQIIGDDYANAPPAHALTSRRMVSNVVGYSVYGDYSEPNPPSRIVEAVAAGRVDVAVVWGPLAGFFAARSPVRLELTPVVQPADLRFLPFAFDIAMGVRKKDKALRSELDTWIGAHGQEIDRLLAEFHIPRADRPGGRP
jgi:mxaJ protein